MRRRSLSRFVYLPQAIFLALIALVTHSTMLSAASHQNAKKIVSVSKELKKKLRIANSLEIKIVESNPMGLSVQPIPQHHGDFLLLVDINLLSRLDKEELRAALAHELGHVWIYTHHPYLQTEALANQIAMRAVTRSSLKNLYGELAAFQGTASNVEALLGAEQTDAVKTASEKQ